MVLGSSEILQDTTWTTSSVDLAQRSVVPGCGWARLVDDILDFSRLEVGQLRLMRSPSGSRTCVDGVAEACRPTGRGGAAWSSSACSTPVCPTRVVGDPERVAQVLGHLVGNAVKFSHEGRVRLAVRPGPGRREPRRLRGERHRDRDRRGAPRVGVRLVRTGRRLHHAALRRTGARAGGVPGAGRPHGWHPRREQPGWGWAASSWPGSRWCPRQAVGRRAERSMAHLGASG